MDQFRDMLTDETWGDVFNKGNVNEAYSCFLDRLLELFDTCCPVERRSGMKRDKMML